MKQFIGRKEEQQILKEALQSAEAEMLAVIGRRRIGKTFLVTSSYEKQIAFEITGVQNASRNQQLRTFADQLQYLAKTEIAPPKDWLDAFFTLRTYLEPHLGKKKIVIFFDELPWLATPRSGFLKALGYFWNSWASRQNMVVVICGSAASWMIQKVVNHKGGLHNRITKYIHLKPFTLSETEAYFKAKGIRFNRYQIVQLYMALGGVPHYLKEVKKGQSAVQNIDHILFAENSFLKNEFSRLYPALFENADYHIAVIRALAKKRQGLTRQQIIQQAKTPQGGATTTILEELVQSGFLGAYYPFGKKKKEMLYRLTDEYSLFYLQFMEDKKNEGSGTWLRLSQKQEYTTWSGYAFESICLKHIPQIKKALGIAGVYTTAASFFKKGTKNDPGTQIDLVLDRNDQIIHLFEIKFHNKTFTLSKSTAEKLREKKEIFEEATGTHKQLFISLITTLGLKPNEHSIGLIDQVLQLDDLFLA
ncbi:MAG: ATP-binding protein [Saprospiraceae bacterium]